MQIAENNLEACVVAACIYGLGTLALTERQEEKMQIAENNWVQRICKLKGSIGSLHGSSLYIRVGNTGTDRETGRENADSRKQLGPKNM